jgi:hypothetical protein
VTYLLYRSLQTEYLSTWAMRADIPVAQFFWVNTQTLQTKGGTLFPADRPGADSNEMVCHSCEIRVDSRGKMRHGFASSQLVTV